MKRTMPAARATLVLAVLLLSGCFQPNPPTTPGEPTETPTTPYQFPTFEWGLNLDVDLLPPPLAFRENASEVNRFSEFIRVAAEPAGQVCDVPAPLAKVEQAIETERHLGAIELLYDECVPPILERAEELAAQAMAERTEDKIWQLLVREAYAATNRSNAKISSLRPDTMLEAELTAYMIRQQRFQENSIRLAFDSFDAYRTDNPTRLQLENAYLQIGSAATEANLSMTLTSLYDWEAFGGCRFSDAATIANEVGPVLERAIEIARNNSAPGDEQYVSTMYGKLLKLDAPGFEKVIERDWFAGVLYYKARVGWDLAYWQNITADHLPTREEAAYLVALHRNQTRSISTEFALEVIDDAVKSDFPWDHKVTEARQALALPGLRSTFEPLACDP